MSLLTSARDWLLSSRYPQHKQARQAKQEAATPHLSQHLPFQGSDGLVHFQWRERSSTAPELNFMVFPQEAVFEKVPTGRDGDRIYQFKYTTTERRYYFWMQEPLDTADEDNVKKLNEYINNPAAAAAAAAPAAGAQAAMMQQLLG